MHPGSDVEPAAGPVVVVVAGAVVGTVGIVVVAGAGG
jgi:hypothetical protein